MSFTDVVLFMLPIIGVLMVGIVIAIAKGEFDDVLGKVFKNEM